MRVFVSVGTDHFPFDRLMSWVGRWAAAHPDDEVVVQHGSSTAPAGVEALTMLTIDEMVEQISGADVVVVSAGPGAVMTARGQLRRPIAVPRHKGEAVDDHQRAFASLMDEQGLAYAADDEATLADLLELARRDPAAFRCEPPAPPTATVRRFADVADRVVSGR